MKPTEDARIKAMKAYRARLLKAGRMLEARAVKRCIELAKAVA